MSDTQDVQNQDLEPTTVPAYVAKPDDEIKQLAKDFVQNKIFTTAALTDASLAPTVFIPLNGLLPEAIVQQMEQDDIGFFYEYLERALPKRNVNGHPMFISFMSLSKSDVDRLQVAVNRINEALAAI